MAVKGKKGKTSSVKKTAVSGGKKHSGGQDLIPVERVKNAVVKLQEFVQANGHDENELIDNSDLKSQLQLIVVNTNSFSGSLKSFKPKLLSVPHSLYQPWKDASSTMVKDFKTLLILKDSDVGLVTADDLVDLLPDHIAVDVIVSGKDLKTKYKAFERRRAFVQEFSLILADDSIVTSLPKLLGGKAYSKMETTPIPIDTRSGDKFNKKTLANGIKKVYDSKIPLRIPRGNTLNVHLGSVEWFTPEQLSDNILSISKHFIDKYEIRTILLKSNESPVLPLYVNLEVLDNLVVSKHEPKSATKNVVEIDGVQLELSQFEKSLLSIANPDELDSLFARQIKRAKRNLEEVEEEETKESIKRPVIKNKKIKN